MYGASLYSANLSEAKLTKAILINANLYGAKLFKTDLSDANLYHINCDEAFVTCYTSYKRQQINTRQDLRKLSTATVNPDEQDWGTMSEAELLKIYKAGRHTHAMALSQEDIQQRLGKLSDWTLKDDKIVKILEFPSFNEAIDFVNEIAKVVIKHDHHPIIAVNWKLVKISLKTFDTNSITERDFSLASAIDELVPQYPNNK